MGIYLNHLLHVPFGLHQIVVEDGGDEGGAQRELKQADFRSLDKTSRQIPGHFGGAKVIAEDVIAQGAAAAMNHERGNKPAGHQNGQQGQADEPRA
jgi:hypothetical protein